MSKLIFIVYPETYVLLSQHRNDDALEGDCRLRVTVIVSAWEAAIQSHDNVERLEISIDEYGKLIFQVFDEVGWDGEIATPGNDQ